MTFAPACTYAACTWPGPIPVPSLDTALVDQPAVTDPVLLVEIMATDGTFTFVRRSPVAGTYPACALPMSLSGGAVQIDLSDRGWTSAQDDARPNTHFEGRIGELRLDRTLPLQPGDDRRLAAAIGEIMVDNADGAFDATSRNLSVDGQPVTVSLLRHRSAPYAARKPLISGLGLDWRPDTTSNRLRYRLRDLGYRLDQPMLDLYGGAGGEDGNATLAGTPRQEVWGLCRGVPLQLLDGPAQVYLASANAVQAIAAVEVRGGPITPGAFYASYALLLAASTTSGTFDWAITPAGSYVKLGSEADGTVTADVQGDTTAGYSNRLAGMMRRILARAGVTYDAGAFDAAEGFAPGAAGRPFGHDGAQVTFADALSALAAGGRLWWGDAGAGLISTGRVTLPAGGRKLLLDRTVITDRVELLDPLGVAWRVTVRYRRNWTPLTDVVEPPAITAERRQELMGEGRSVAVATPSRRARNPQALDLVIDSLFDQDSDAQALGQNDLNLRVAGANLYRVPLGLAGYDIPLQAQARLVTSDCGLSNGLDVRVVGHSARRGGMALTVLG